MDEKKQQNDKYTSAQDAFTDEDVATKNNKGKFRVKKRKRRDSDSSTDLEDVLPENMLEMEKNLHASAIKNNLDDVSVKKILKKVVTNDHVLALVKLREEEEDSGTEEKNLRPKLTRAKFKELMKVSPKSGPWNLELTPIKHIPVKTRPEVKALIAQELPEDEDDDEYKPTHDDVPSDDDQTLESCSDLDSQPRTPVTPSSRHSDSPKVVKDGPFKVPQDISTPVRRKLVIEEKATIALRTRSKLSLSATPIEHIESSFVPPDDIPTPDIDDPVWDEFLTDCLNPACVSRTEEDDEADPEYNVAADPDAHDEDEEALENSIIKISKKELNDLVTELFSIMPEATVDDALAEGLANDVLTDTLRSEVPSHWEGKQEPMSDEETKKRSERITFDRDRSRLSIGKTEPEYIDYCSPGKSIKETDKSTNSKVNNNLRSANANYKPLPKLRPIAPKKPIPKSVNISVVEQTYNINVGDDRERSAPPLLRGLQAPNTKQVHIHIDKPVCILPEQKLIIEQQLRQHVQLATSNFLQLYVHPSHWSLAPTYKEYLEQLVKILSENRDSIVNVCNLKPALELVECWEKTVAEDTPENKKMVEFIQNESEKSRRRFNHNSIYAGEFPEMFKNVIANSCVFLYPYLLPAMPYRPDRTRKFSYRRCEDELIVLGLDQFWQYVEDNPELYKMPARPHPRHRWGLAATVELVCKHMLPWLTVRYLLAHIHKARTEKDKDNPIVKFFKNREVVPVEHKLLPFNPNLTLYEQPEHEMPRIWIRYLAKSSKRFRNHLYRRKNSGLPPVEGVSVNMGSKVKQPKKEPLPIDFTKPIIATRINLLPKITPVPLADKFDVEITGNPVNNVASPNVASGNILVVGNTDSANVVGNLVPTGNMGTTNEPPSTVTDMATNNVTPANNANNTPDAPKIIVLTTGNSHTTNVITTSNSVILNNISTGKVIATVKVLTTNKVLNAGDVASGISVGDTATANISKANNVIEGSQEYKVVETSTGAFLIPVTVVQTNTVNSTITPITSSVEKIVETEPEGTVVVADSVTEVDEELKNHCRCCILLRKICKQKQSLITDFFKLKNSVMKTCQCSKQRYPKVSKRLKMLIKNYKSKSWCVYRELQSKLNTVKKETKDKCDSESETETNDDSYNLDDIAFVTTFQLKLTSRSNIIRNTGVKKRVNTLFSKFDPDTGDPVRLADQLYKVFDIDLVDLYKEFLGFLTAEQADEIHKFKDYFTQSCLSELVKKIDAVVADKIKRRAILSNLNGLLEDSVSTSCEMCSSILDTLHGLPELAQYVFSLFPHKVISRKTDGDKPEAAVASSQLKQTPSESSRLKETEDQIQEIEHDPDQADDSLTICDESQTAMDYEADHSSCGEGNSDEESVVDRVNIQYDESMKTEMSHTSVNVIDTPELTISKTEVQEFESSDMSMLAMSEDEPVKCEASEWRETPEWKREEDKQILEILIQYLAPQDRKGKTILEIVEEKNVMQMLSKRLPDKSIGDIKERVLYLLEILVLSDLS